MFIDSNLKKEMNINKSTLIIIHTIRVDLFLVCY